MTEEGTKTQGRNGKKEEYKIRNKTKGAAKGRGWKATRELKMATGPLKEKK